MATKTNAPPRRVKKQWDLPGRLAGRNAEVMPVGAWVQPESIIVHQSYEAVVSAAEEEARIRHVHDEKQRRLRQFQADVKKRVAHMDRMKKEHQLAQSYKAVEVERKVLCQSASAAERHTPRINRCSIRDDTSHIIRQSASLNTQGGIITGDSLEEERGRVFEEQSQKVHQFTCAARRKLTSKRVITENFMRDDLPGGIWKTGATLDNPVSRQTQESDVIDLEEAEVGEFIPGDHDPGAGYTLEEEVDAGRAGDHLADKENSAPPRVVHFDPETGRAETRQERITRKSTPAICGTDVSRVMPVPNIYPGVASVEERQRAVTQRAMYRRLFMDIEREQVKENQRAHQHRLKIAQLKREKEEARHQEELSSKLQVTPKDPVTGETEGEMVERQRKEEHISLRREEERRQRARRSVEASRFMDALKAQLREKMAAQNVDLPALCCCGPTVWDTSPDTCANNCVFYRNPKAYTRALQSLLSSCDVA